MMPIKDTQHLFQTNCYCDVVEGADSLERADSLGLELVQKSISLQRDRHAYGIELRNVNITVDGKLTCRTRWGIEVRNADTLDIISTMKNTNTTEWEEIIQPEEVVVASCYNRNERSTEVILLDPNTLEKTKSLFKSDRTWPPTYYDQYRSLFHMLCHRPSFFSHGLAQFKSLVYILDRGEKQLVVCNLVDNKIQKFPLPEMNSPVPICILPDSTLLIGDYTEDGKVRRYKVEDTTLTQMWEFPHILYPAGISFDPTSELIYICTANGSLFIISMEGKEIMQYL